MAGGTSKGKGKQIEPPRRHHASSQKHRKSSHTAHAPHEYEKFFPCMRSNHSDCKWKSSGDIQCGDGHRRAVSWQKCRKEDAREFLKQFKAPPGGDEIQEAAEAEPPPPQPDQAAQSQQAEQPQGTRGEEAAAGPSSTQAPAAEAAPPVSQQEAGTNGGNTVPGPFGQPVPAPGVPPPPAQHVPFAQGVPGNAGMGYATGSQNMAGIPGNLGTGYSQNIRYPQNTAYPQETPFSGGYGGGGDTNYSSGYLGGQNMSSTGGYEGGYDMELPEYYDEGEEILFSEDMPFDESYGGYEEVPMTGGPVDSAGNVGPQSSAVVAPVEARAKWVATSPENLYHSEGTDGTARDRPYTTFKSVWTNLNFSKL